MGPGDVGARGSRLPRPRRRSASDRRRARAIPARRDRAPSVSETSGRRPSALTKSILQRSFGPDGNGIGTRARLAGAARPGDRASRPIAAFRFAGDQPRGPALAQTVCRLGPFGQCATRTRLQGFFRTISCRMCRSRVRSATHLGDFLAVLQLVLMMRLSKATPAGAPTLLCL